MILRYQKPKRTNNQNPSLHHLQLMFLELVHRNFQNMLYVALRNVLSTNGGIIQYDFLLTYVKKDEF